MKTRTRRREDRPSADSGFIAVLIVAAICIVLIAAVGGCYLYALFCEAAPVAEDDDGQAVQVDDLRQVVLHFDDNTWTEYVMHRDDVDRFIRGITALDDEQMTGITVYRMRRGWPSSWTREELRTLFGDSHAPVYDWSLHESTLQLGE